MQPIPRVFVDDIFGQDIHVQLIQSFAVVVFGVLHAGMLSIAVIGRAMADIVGLKHKSGVQQIDRLLSNDGLKLDDLERVVVRYVVGGLPELTVAIDWTDFDDDDHTTLCMYWVTRQDVFGTDYAFRFLDVILVTDADGNRAPVGEYLWANGRPRSLILPQLTGKKTPITAVIVTKAKRMQEPWSIEC